MNPTAVRAFQRSATRFSASGASEGNATVRWFAYFAGITALMGAGAGVLYKMNEENSISASFKKNGVNQTKV